MIESLPSHYACTLPVTQALRSCLPVVALESTVITHGLPRPQNLELARSMIVSWNPDISYGNPWHYPTYPWPKEIGHHVIRALEMLGKTDMFEASWF